MVDQFGLRDQDFEQQCALSSQFLFQQPKRREGSRTQPAAFDRIGLTQTIQDNLSTPICHSLRFAAPTSARMASRRGFTWTTPGSVAARRPLGSTKMPTTIWTGGLLQLRTRAMLSPIAGTSSWLTTTPDFTRIS